MRPFSVKRVPQLKGKISLAGDKSIAHRSIILSAITCGKTVIKNFPASRDCLYTLEAFRDLGIKISLKRGLQANTVIVQGKGLWGLREPRSPIFIGDSGTTLRLLLGILSGQNFPVTLTAGKSLSLRPMLRVTAPLRMMGATIKSKVKRPAPGGYPESKVEEYPPITVRGGGLKAITYKMPVASAQVKSAILLAGLFAKGKTSIIESVKTRDHTERILKLFKAAIKINKSKIIIRGNQELISPGKIFIPGDISSAGFFIVLGAVLPNSLILIKNVNLNPTRTGVVSVLKRMGADIKVHSFRRRRTSLRLAPSTVHSEEPAGDLMVKGSKLKGTVVRKEEIPFLIDELPVLMVAACFASGKTVFEGVQELRVKETDRIISMSANLKRMGASIEILKRAGSEKIIIKGMNGLKGTAVKSFGDHRTAMSMVVAGLKASGITRIDDISCISKSFPDFLHLLRNLIK